MTVREVVRPPRLTAVPHAPPSLLGLGNLRGTVLPIVSLRALLGRPAAAGGRIIVLEQDPPVGVMVDQVGAITRTKDSAGESGIDLSALVAKAFSALSPTRRATRVGMVSALADRAVTQEVVLLAFAAGGQEYSLPLSQVDQVLPWPDEITPIPHSEPVVLGTIARQGRLLPLLSLPLLLGLEPIRHAGRPRIVIARLGRHQVGLAVDDVHSILRVPESAIDPVPAILTRGSGEARIQSIARLENGKRLVSVLASDSLLRGDLAAQLQTGGEEDAMDDANAQQSVEQFLIFRVGDQDFGLPLAAVEEVAMLPDRLTPLPRAPAFVEGVMNLRGQVIPVIDQGRRFRLEGTGGKRRRVIVVKLGASQAGFTVDAVAEVLRVPVTSLRAAPELGEQGTGVFDRVANLEHEGRMILIIEPGELLDRAERDMIEQMNLGDGNARS